MLGDMAGKGVEGAGGWEAGRSISQGNCLEDVVIALFETDGAWWWTAWYALLWIGVLPFATLLVYTFVRVTPARSGEESTWLNGAVLLAFVVLVVTSLASALLYAHAQPGHTWWTYLLWLAIHFACWTFLGSGVVFASLQALAAGPRVWLRRLSALLAVAGVSLFHLASLFATATFRGRL